MASKCHDANIIKQQKNKSISIIPSPKPKYINSCFTGQRIKAGSTVTVNGLAQRQMLDNNGKKIIFNKGPSRLRSNVII